MKSIVGCLALMLGGLAIATPAKAEIFVNRKGTREGHSMCMGVAGGVDSSGRLKGNKLVVWQCTGSQDQSWIENALGTSFKQIQDLSNLSNGSPACLIDPINFNLTDNGNQLLVGGCNSSAGEEFILTQQQTCINGSCVPETDGVGNCFRIQDQLTKSFVGVANGQANPITNGMEIIMWSFTPSEDQVWCVHPNPVMPP